MIHAGMMSTGSAKTVGVAGEYWINSTSSLRITTLPGVAATSRPSTNFSVPLGPLPSSVRSMSSNQWPKPRMRF